VRDGHAAHHREHRQEAEHRQEERRAPGRPKAGGREAHPGGGVSAHYRRALQGQQFCKLHRDITHELLLVVENDLRSDIVLVNGGGWQPNPHQGRS
jgi:hypothetical protein